MKHFEYFEIRACLDLPGHDVQSFTGSVWCPLREGYIGTPETARADAQAYFEAAGGLGEVNPFWTLYGHWTDGTAQTIGDFKTFEAAYEVMQGILMPMRKAADMIANDDGHSAADAGSMLEDICNQSSTEDRL